MTVAKPLVKLDRSLQTLCSINRRLRTVFVHDLYKKVTFNLKRNKLQAQSAGVFQFLQDVETFGISRFIRTVQINDVYKDMTLTGQGIDTSLHLDSPTAKISTRKKAPLFTILQRILSCASDL
ncbi:uncharacterized protein STEHIDRAFT_123688, partial [Stereum hirsutum FP-91666 SS1]|uniref:uncharacterized protein n=1 Tax=Stereum hirsutum (strain FP-91666) TaxID=721885 RepID=UPI0004449E07